MRFLLYNIRYGAGVGTKFHFPVPYAGYLKKSRKNYDEISEFIKESAPDIIGLVEVDSGSFRADRFCQAEALARKLGYHFVVSSKYKEHSVAHKVPVLSKQGNALLSKQEIGDYQFHFFDQGTKRLVIEARIGRVTVFVVHLSLTFRKRQAQLAQLYKLVMAAEGPVIVAGDFNVLWGHQELDLFLAATGLASANSNDQPSYPSHSPRRQLDFILFNSDLRVTRFSIPQVTFSDHAPLVCDFDWT